MDQFVLCWDGGYGLSRDNQALHHGMSGQIVRYGLGRFHPAPFVKERGLHLMATIENPGGVAVGLPSNATQRRVSLFDQVNINVFWIANNFHWQALLAIVIPSMVVKFL